MPNLLFVRLRLWDVETGATEWEVRVHTGVVLSVAIAPDGKQALSGNGDHTVRLWDIETGAALGRFVEEGKRGEWFSAVAFTPDGRRILAGGGSKFLLWRVPSEWELKIWRLMGGKLPAPPEPETEESEAAR